MTSSSTGPCRCCLKAMPAPLIAILIGICLNFTFNLDAADASDPKQMQSQTSGPAEVQPQGHASGQADGNDELDDAFYDDDLDFMEGEDTQPLALVADPLESWNRLMFQFNDRLYFWALKPAAQGYNAIMPITGRIAVRNFL